MFKWYGPRDDRANLVARWLQHRGWLPGGFAPLVSWANGNFNGKFVHSKRSRCVSLRLVIRHPYCIEKIA